MQLDDRSEVSTLLPGAILPSHAAYDEHRATFNGMLDRRPAAIVPCHTTDDVVAAVRAARAAALPIAIRGGGHSVAGHCVADGALVVDLRHMRAIEIDPDRRIAWAQGGAQWLDIDTATIAHGLATTGGTFVDTGIAGLTLTGGIGYLMGTGGFTCDTLVGAEVVKADGEIIRAGPAEDGGDPDLLWALRGGGGNFGVVTAFEYHLQPVGELIFARIVVPIEHLRDLLRTAAALAHRLPDEMNVYIAGPSYDAPDDRDPDPATEPLVLSINFTFQGSAADGEAAIEPLSRLRGRPGVHGGFVPITYPEAQARNGILPFGLRHYWKGHFLRELDDAAIESVIHAAATVPPSSAFLLLEAVTGQARREPDGGAAFGQREAWWNASALGVWEDAADDDENIAWVRRTADALGASSFSGAGYGNYGQADEPIERVRAAFGAEHWERLRALKRRYDPDNVFRFNHNIPPAEA